MVAFFGLVLALLALTPALVYLHVYRKRNRIPKRRMRLSDEPQVMAGEAPPTETGRWKIEPIMKTLRAAKEAKAAADEKPADPPPVNLSLK